jgi:hypothetical protein
MADQDLLVRPAAQPFIEPEPPGLRGNAATTRVAAAPAEAAAVGTSTPGLLGNAATTRVAAGSLLFAEAGGASGKSVTAEYARSLSDDELTREIATLEMSIGGVFGSFTVGSFTTAGALRHNLLVLRGERNRRRPEAATIPPGGENIGKVGIVAWDGQPALRLRTSPQTNEEQNILGELPFNTRLQVIKKFPGDWYFVSTTNGDLGYAGSQYIRTDLPEPTARLHRVEAGLAGTAIAIAERYYGTKAQNWGQDLRFYVNVLARVNRVPVPDTTDGWRAVHFQAGQVIWVPGQAFAFSLKGIVNSGSYSYNVADFLGLADLIERIGELIEDYEMAIDKSKAYLWESITRHVEEMLWEALKGLAWTLAIAAGLLAVTTAIGAGLGALAGGALAAPGAAAGFEVGMALLEWLGLAMLVAWIGQSLLAVGAAFATFLAAVWNARGNEAAIDKAARLYAEAIGLLLAKLLEALLMWIMAKGLPAAMKQFKGSRLGQAMGETKTAEWLAARSKNVASGQSKLKSPSAVLRGVLGGPHDVPVEMTVNGNGAQFHNLPVDRLPPLPEGYGWSRSAANEWVMVRSPDAPPATFDLTVYSDAAGNTNYVLRSNGRTVVADALTRTGSTYARGQQRLPQDLAATGADNPFHDPSTGQVYDKSHGVDYADTLEGPGVRSSTTDPVNFTPGASWWNRGPRNILVQRIRGAGGGYRELAVYDASPRLTANGTPIPREFVFVETNRAGVPQRAWRVPNDPALTDRSLGALLNRDIPLSQVPRAALRADAPVVPDGPGVRYLPGVIIGHPGDDEKTSAATP